ncbi:MFS transporter [Variovorax sp. TBS-050B]|uniref:MFS transporter n=1 Tax=Variovorax sp. TBS-050B TaxID=2940551 RepID=UPI002473B889|nr:MFS transporter [Variovorax sp. TBS-050B]
MESKAQNNSVWHLIVSRGLASLGGSIASFGIDVWFYKKTGSYSNFAVIAILTILPPIIFSPIAGFFADRANKSKILFWAELSTVLLFLLLGGLYLAEKLGFLAIATCIFLVATAAEFRYTAMVALIPELASKEKLNSVNGIQQAFRGAVIVIGPPLGALGYKYSGLILLLSGAILLSFYSIYVARTLSLSHVGGEHENLRPVRSTFFKDYATSIEWINSKPGLKVVLFHFTLIYGVISIFGTLLTPHILTIKDEGWLAAVTSAQGGGLIAAGIVLGKFGEIINPQKLLFLGCHVMGVIFILFGIFNQEYAMIGLSLALGATISTVSAANQTIWQSNTPFQMQGKITALRSIMLYLFSPAAIYASIPISDFFKGVVHRGFMGAMLPKGGHGWSNAMFVSAGISVLLASFLVFLIFHRKIALTEVRVEGCEEWKK